MKTDNTTENVIEQDFLAGDEYHFSGGGGYEPVTIRAASLAEATVEWEKIKVPYALPITK